MCTTHGLVWWSVTECEPLQGRTTILLSIHQQKMQMVNKALLEMIPSLAQKSLWTIRCTSQKLAVVPALWSKRPSCRSV